MFDIGASGHPGEAVRTRDAARSAAETLLQAPKAKFKAGQAIRADADDTGALYYVDFGLVRVCRTPADGRRQICSFHFPGEVFGFDAGARRHFAAEAVTSTGLRILRPDAAAPLSQDLLKLALASVDRANDHLINLGRQECLHRVAGFLLEMIDRQSSAGDGIVNLPMTRADIADYLGLTVESISRALTKLRERGIIRMPSARRVDVLRRQTLRACCA